MAPGQRMEQKLMVVESGQSDTEYSVLTETCEQSSSLAV